MRYKKLIIKYNNIDEFVKIQKHLFLYKYSWCLNNIRSHQIKKKPYYYANGLIASGTGYIVIGNDDILNNVHSLTVLDSFNYKIVYDFMKQIERKAKIKKINNG